MMICMQRQASFKRKLTKSSYMVGKREAYLAHVQVSINRKLTKSPCMVWEKKNYIMYMDLRNSYLGCFRIVYCNATMHSAYSMFSYHQINDKVFPIINLSSLSLILKQTQIVNVIFLHDCDFCIFKEKQSKKYNYVDN